MAVVVVGLPVWVLDVVDVVGRTVVVVVMFGFVVDVVDVVVDVVVVDVVVVKIPTMFPPASEQVPLAVQVMLPELGG
ncbi:MAG: hypothetical protein ABSF33_07335 [Acidimicrobiales bacterium]